MLCFLCLKEQYVFTLRVMGIKCFLNKWLSLYIVYYTQNQQY